MTTDSLLGNGAGPPLAAYSGPFSCAAGFFPLQYVWVYSYKIWVPVGGDVSATYNFCLYQLTDTTHSISNMLVPGSGVTKAGGMTAGAWNIVNLPTPIALPPSISFSTPGPAYEVCVGWTAVNGFPDTDHFWPAAGLTSPNGLLFAYSDQGSNGGTAPEPYTSNYFQGLFSSTVSNPITGTMPATPNVTTNFGIDLVVSTVAPSGASFRRLPSFPYLINWANDTANNFTLGTEFTLSQACTLDNYWFYSPAGVTQLPTSVGIFRVSDQSLQVSNPAPTWSGLAGSGFVKVADGVTVLPAGTYKVAVCNGAGVPAIWNAQIASVWGTPGFAQNGLTFGPVTWPNNASSSPGQGSYNAGAALTYPNTTAGPYDYGVDAEFTPIVIPGPTITPSIYAGKGIKLIG